MRPRADFSRENFRLSAYEPVFLTKGTTRSRDPKTPARSNPYPQEFPYRSGAQQMTVTRAHLIKSISRQVDLPKGQCSQVLETLLEFLIKTLQSGEDVLISGFGRFCVNEKKERRGRDPATGEDMMLRKRKVVAFRCSGVLKEKMNGVRSRRKSSRTRQTQKRTRRRTTQ
jgi:integration host factor subunit alpha